MPYAAQQPTARLTFVDESGSPSLMRIWLSDTHDEASGLAALASLVVALQPSTGCTLVRYSLSFPYKDLSISGQRSTVLKTPLARYIYELTSDADVHDSYLMPFSPDWVLADGPFAGVGLDLTNADLITFTNVITNDGYTDPFASDIGALVAAFIEDVL